jgi:hypothetical protein
VIANSHLKGELCVCVCVCVSIVTVTVTVLVIVMVCVLNDATLVNARTIKRTC